VAIERADKWSSADTMPAPTAFVIVPRPGQSIETMAFTFIVEMCAL
jgi:hypothetical protein